MADENHEVENLENAQDEIQEQEEPETDEQPESDEDESADQEAPEPEEWQTSEDDDEPLRKGDGRSIPKRKFIDTKNKLKQLRGSLSSRDDEIAQLKAKIESFEKATLSQQTPPQPIRRPDDTDFDSDAEYQEAVAKYDNDLITRKFNELDQQRQRERILAELKQSRAKAVDEHYQRAQKLVDEAGINPEVYHQSDLKVRQAINSIRPGVGNDIVDDMIDKLGEGSEKVLYYLGRNQTALDRFKSLFTEDPTGIRAILFLGQQKERLTAPKKIKSRARPPAPTAKGDSNMGNNVRALKKKYDDAHKKKDSQSAWKFRREARLAGIDTSTW